MNNTTDILQIQSLQKIYKKATTSIEIFEDLSFKLKKNVRAVISGESGSGKTTLLSIISGLDSCEKGSVIISAPNDILNSSSNTSLHTFNMTAANERARAHFRLHNIGFVFQYHYLLQDFSALGNVMLPLLMIGAKKPHKAHKKKQARELATQMLSKVGLSQRIKHNPSQLSGGECQRVAIARALVHCPSLILADEPTGALDSKNSLIIRDLLCTLVEDMKTSLLVATHDKNFLAVANCHWHLENKNLFPQNKHLKKQIKYNKIHIP